MTFTHTFTSPEATYFAFTYPFSYEECKTYFDKVEATALADPETFYFTREVLAKSMEKRDVELITISAPNDITEDREDFLEEPMFPDRSKPRPLKFTTKPVIFFCARVHPGEV